MWRIREIEFEINLVIYQLLLKLWFQFLESCLEFPVSSFEIRTLIRNYFCWFASLTNEPVEG